MCNWCVSPDEADIERQWHIKSSGMNRSRREIFPRTPGPFIRSSRHVAEPKLVLWGQVLPFAGSSASGRYARIEPYDAGTNLL